MSQRLKMILIILFILLVSISFYGKKKDIEKPLVVPKNAILISQSCTQWYLFVTLIDLDNNEMVILRYGTVMGGNDLEDVIRTGVFIDPNKQIKIAGQSAPFDKPKRM